MAAENIYIPVWLKEVVTSMTIQGIASINFQAGSNIQVVNELIKITNGDNVQKLKAYPLIAVLLPIKEHNSGEYIDVTIKELSIATLTTETTPVLDRYNAGGTFAGMLYPVFNEFLKRLARHPRNICKDPAMIEYDKYDNPGSEPIHQTEDWVDMITLQNVKFKLSKLVNC